MYFGGNCAIDCACYWVAQMNDIRIFDWGAIGVTAAAVMEWLPAVSCSLSIIWLSLRIWQQLKEMRNGRRD